MKLASLKVKVFSEADAATLESSITAFLRSSGEATFVQIEFAVTGGVYSAIILYAN